MTRERALGHSDACKSAEHWTTRAQEVRRIAEVTPDPDAKAIMRTIVADYEEFARQAAAGALPAGVTDHGPHPAGTECTAHHYTAIVESSDDAIISKNLEGVITSWNRSAQRLYGYTAAEAVGRPVTLIIPTDRHDEEPVILERVRRGEKIEHYETIRRRKDGTLVDISLTVSPIKNERGEIIGASKIARDISDRRRAQERQKLLLREMNHRVKNLFTLAISVLNISGRSAASVREVIASASDRLSALARAHTLTLTAEKDEDSQGPKPATLYALIHAIVAPHEYRTEADSRRIYVTGSDLEISAAVISSLALLIHEFATNSTKYGALSAEAGTVQIECADDGKTVSVIWSESGGPRVVAPTEKGFGDTLIRSAVSGMLGGNIFHDWKPEGLIIRLLIPRQSLVA